MTSANTDWWYHTKIKHETKKNGWKDSIWFRRFTQRHVRVIQKYYRKKNVALRLGSSRHVRARSKQNKRNKVNVIERIKQVRLCVCNREISSARGVWTKKLDSDWWVFSILLLLYQYWVFFGHSHHQWVFVHFCYFFFTFINNVNLLHI